MSKSVFDYISNLDTLLAVALGAVLATTGALIAELIQDRLNRRRRERDAARFFGEIMMIMDRVLAEAIRTHGIGEPWGPVTRRLYQTALREAQVYERNRERLFDIRDMNLRARIHAHMLRKTFPVDAIIEYCHDIDAVEDALTGDVALAAERRERMETRAALLRTQLESARQALQNEVTQTASLCSEVGHIAGVDFTRIADSAAAASAPARPTEPAASA